MNTPGLRQVEFHGDGALHKTIIDETIKVLEIIRHLIDGRTLFKLGIEIQSERFGDVRAVFGRTWRHIAYSHGDLD